MCNSIFLLQDYEAHFQLSITNISKKNAFTKAVIGNPQKWVGGVD